MVHHKLGQSVRKSQLILFNILHFNYTTFSLLIYTTSSFNLGQCVCEKTLEISAAHIYEWGQSTNCPKTQAAQNIGDKNIENVCLSGPWMANRNLNLSSCNGIHPFPIFFESSLIIWPSIKYEISLFLSWKKRNSESVTTIWGFQGVPKIKIPFQEPIFYWQQEYRKGLSSSVSSGQFPIAMYIR